MNIHTKQQRCAATLKNELWNSVVSTPSMGPLSALLADYFLPS